MAATDSIFPDHENEPHPAFGWPTLTHPAVGANVPGCARTIPRATASFSMPLRFAATREPGCAVISAAAAGTMHPRRYESYRRLRRLYEELTEARGPLLVTDYGSTTLMPPGWRAELDQAGNLILTPA